MQDEILKKIYENVNGVLSNELNEYEANARQSSNNLAIKDAVTKEICVFVIDSLGKLLQAAATQDSEKQVNLLETGIRMLMTKLSDHSTKMHDEALRASGVALGVEASNRILTKGFEYYEKELATARDIIARQEEGDLSKRSLGTRPNKLKDARNYTIKDKSD